MYCPGETERPPIAGIICLIILAVRQQKHQSTAVHREHSPWFQRLALHREVPVCGKISPVLIGGPASCATFNSHRLPASRDFAPGCRNPPCSNIKPRANGFSRHHLAIAGLQLQGRAQSIRRRPVIDFPVRGRRRRGVRAVFGQDMRGSFAGEILGERIVVEPFDPMREIHVEVGFRPQVAQ